MYYLPFVKYEALHLNKIHLNLLHPRMLYAKFGSNWPSGSGEREENVKVYDKNEEDNGQILIRKVAHSEIIKPYLLIGCVMTYKGFGYCKNKNDI